jgi:hypothetical protein
MGNQCGGACGGSTPEEGEILIVNNLINIILGLKRKECKESVTTIISS